MIDPVSFDNAQNKVSYLENLKWLDEIKANAPETPIILIGTKGDLKSEVEPNKYITKEMVFEKIHFIGQKRSPIPASR